MIDSLLLHPRTRNQLVRFISSPSHAVLLDGPLGSGKQTTATALAASILGLESIEKLSHYPYYTVINPDTNAITIDEIRAAQNLLFLRVPKGDTQIRRVIVVIDANRMRSEAQNAFLKTLEEPPLDTCIILTLTGKNILPTITSRAQSITILPVSESQASDYYKTKGVASLDLHKNYALSQGQVGLLSSLINNEEHALKPWVQTAKEILGEPTGSRILRTDTLAKNKDDIKLLLDALSRIAHSALMHAASQDKRAAVDRWTRSQVAIQDSLKALSYNASTKLLLDNLFLNL